MYVSAMTHAIGYVRVSTSEQGESGLGLEAQREAIRAEALRQGWELVTIHEDAGASGKSVSGRPGLERALAAVKDYGADAVLVVAKLDRLSRSMKDFADLMEVSQKQSWGLVALDLGVDTSTPSGEMQAMILATFAQFERRLIGQRTKDALAIKKAEGVKLGRPTITSPETIRLVHVMREEGRSLQAIADHLDREGVPRSHGGKRWYPSTVKRLLEAKS
ncbi:MAG: Resolvase, N-terminal domain [Acidimicrobiales bacterium]|nr:Resolvase, N-terminal domain [Acidimicrobiales bacterium]